MVNARLVDILERNNVLSPHQFGFRRNRSTIDSLMSLSLEIEEAFSNKEHLIAIFLDLEKAYDTMERGRVLEILKRLGVEKNLWTYIKNFLTGRTFCVRVGESLSSNYSLERGTPQGSPLSATLFLLAINGISSNIRNPIKCFMFADDVVIAARN